AARLTRPHARIIRAPLEIVAASWAGRAGPGPPHARFRSLRQAGQGERLHNSILCCGPWACGTPVHDSLISMRLLLGLATALGAASASAATVSGTVFLRSGESRRPLVGVRVTARADHGSELLQSAETDGQGRYLLRDLPKNRIVLSAGRAGYA